MTLRLMQLATPPGHMRRAKLNDGQVRHRSTARATPAEELVKHTVIAPSDRYVPSHVLDAARAFIRWAGDTPEREGLVDTPRRVARAWGEYCQGHREDPGAHLSRQFQEVCDHDEIVLLRDIPFQSHCKHHMAPIIGKAAIAYRPAGKVVGISKLARVLHRFARRLQIQGRLTAEIAQRIWDNLEPQGVAVVTEAQHRCMIGREVRMPGVGKSQVV
jgi:GTP cyclohydrolase I